MNRLADSMKLADKIVDSLSPLEIRHCCHNILRERSYLDPEIDQLLQTYQENDLKVLFWDSLVDTLGGTK